MNLSKWLVTVHLRWLIINELYVFWTGNRVLRTSLTWCNGQMLWWNILFCQFIKEQIRVV